uniref:Secreted protein n=1 Tax=Arundo donax TaxID=35708 RepID=A0A0A9GPW4_ARUDO
MTLSRLATASLLMASPVSLMTLSRLATAFDDFATYLILHFLSHMTATADVSPHKCQFLPHCYHRSAINPIYT